MGVGSFVWEVRQEVLSKCISDGLEDLDASSRETSRSHLTMREISGTFDNRDGFVAWEARNAFM